ncbi:MAG: 16S rRNA (guanine(966)-N(2))-methyltransferase RsmD [Erysipelotrichales bacterium]
MQINRGMYRGLKIDTLDGEHTRPTSAKVREAIFNMLMYDIHDAKVLDLFAGSGALSIEAISSNASFVHINDFNKQAITIINNNLSKIKSDNYKVSCLDYKDLLNNSNDKFDIIFLDPPYHLELINDLIKMIDDLKLLNEDGIIVCESSLKEDVIDSYGLLSKYKEKKYGTIKVSMFRSE